jgi:hypothetical protein
VNDEYKFGSGPQGNVDDSVAAKSLNFNKIQQVQPERLTRMKIDNPRELAAFSGAGKLRENSALNG